MTSAHVIYGISLNPIEWPPLVYTVMEYVNYLVFALDRYPIGCYLNIPFHIYWMALTALPYTIALSLCILYAIKLKRALLFAGCRRAKSEVEFVGVPVAQIL